jgi:hypothetical protein
LGTNHPEKFLLWHEVVLFPPAAAELKRSKA